METLKIGRQELYTLVWNKPVSRLADELNVKAADLRKYCKALNIPLPEQGHWSRIQFGKPVEQVPLPPAPEPISPEPAPDTTEPAPIVVQNPEPPIYFPGETELSFKVPDRLINPDPLILAAERGLKRRRWSKTDMAATDEHQLPIRVSEAHIGRALRIMDTLVKCWKRRGYTISIQYREAYVHLREVKDRFSLREISKKLPKKGEYDRQEYEPTGQFAFRTDWPGKEWKDGRLPLEDQILSILNYMELDARRLERTWAENAKKREMAEALRRQKELVIKNQQAELEAFNNLLRDAVRWKQLQVLDAYLAALSASQEHTPTFIAWLEWAKQKRAAAEPTSNFELTNRITD